MEFKEHECYVAASAVSVSVWKCVSVDVGRALLARVRFGLPPHGELFATATVRVETFSVPAEPSIGTDVRVVPTSLPPSPRFEGAGDHLGTTYDVIKHGVFTLVTMHGASSVLLGDHGEVWPLTGLVPIVDWGRGARD